ATPVLTDLRLEAHGFALQPDSLTPSRLPDLFAGTPLCVLGRYQGPPEGTLTLHALDRAGRPWSMSVRGRHSAQPAAAASWARARLRELEDRYASAESGLPQLEQQIVALS